MKKYEYEIAGLDCAACANEIQEGLNKNPEIAMNRGIWNA